MFNLKKLFISTAVFMFVLTLCTLGAYADTNIQGVISGKLVNIREKSSTDAKVITTLKKGTHVSVITTSGDWSKVKYNRITGWVLSGLMSTSKTSRSASVTGTVTAETLNVRSKAVLSSSLVDKLKRGEKVNILQKSNGWLKIKSSDGKTGWVSSKYISTKSVNSSKSKTSRGGDVGRSSKDEYEITTSDDARGQQVIEYAKKFLGTKYVYGGNSPEEGFDCSGFTKYVYRHFDVSLDRTAAEQATQGKKVSRDNLKTGDLIFFDTDGGYNHINHVGIYIGNGKFIHASSPRYDVTITELSEDFYNRSYMTARRLLN
jgi:cell wall-associated NlpC family hydrolase